MLESAPHDAHLGLTSQQQIVGLLTRAWTPTGPLRRVESSLRCPSNGLSLIVDSGHLAIDRPTILPMRCECCRGRNDIAREDTMVALTWSTARSGLARSNSHHSRTLRVASRHQIFLTSSVWVQVRHLMSLCEAVPR